MAKKLVKKQTGGPRSTRVAARAERVMGRATKNANKYNEAVSNYNPSETSNYDAYVNKLGNKVARQEERAKNLKAKANMLKAEGKKKGGSVKSKK